MKILKSYWLILVILIASLVHSGCTSSDENRDSNKEEVSDSTKVEKKKG